MNMELFYDYACPYCYQGHKNLLELLPAYPDLTIEWKPCEAHPRPEYAEVHSDLAIQGMYIIKAQNGDLMKYHELVYHAGFDQQLDISNLSTLAECGEQCGVDRDLFLQVLKANTYAAKVTENNIRAWTTKQLQAVPSYCSGGHLIGSANGVLVSKAELKKFIDSL